MSHPGAGRRPDAAVVSFESVSFRFRDGAPILRDVSLDVVASEVLVLVGRSGAGKSTVLKLVNGMLLPSSGSVTVEGRTRATGTASGCDAASATSCRMSGCFHT